CALGRRADGHAPTSHATLPLLLRLRPPPLLFLCHHSPTTPVYTLSLHDALPIWSGEGRGSLPPPRPPRIPHRPKHRPAWMPTERSEEHTSELQSPDHLVCRLLLEKKNKLSTERSTTCIGGCTDS